MSLHFRFVIVPILVICAFPASAQTSSGTGTAGAWPYPLGPGFDKLVVSNRW
jgi:hypothetical protein